MSEVAASELKQAVEAEHGGTATFVQFVPVRERHNGETGYRSVAVFDLTGHPKANRVYAWSNEAPGGRRRFYAVLGIPPVDSPAAAVRAAIAARAPK
jgi:hypothetical protein